MKAPFLVCAAAALSLALTACGGGTLSKPPSPSALASRLGCSGYSSTSPTLFAREEGGCTLSGDSLDVATFSTSANEDDWIKIASQFGGIIIEGPLWVVAVTGSQATANAVKAKLGGTIVS